MMLSPLYVCESLLALCGELLIIPVLLSVNLIKRGNDLPEHRSDTTVPDSDNLYD